MNKKGFTLIELLAVIVILGIVMAIAIPGINAVINNTRKNAFVSDAKMFADAARTGILGEQFKAPITGVDTVIRIDKLELEKGGVNSSYGSSWDHRHTYILVTKNGDKNDYYFAGQDSAGNRILLNPIESLTANSVVTDGIITTITDGGTGGQTSISIRFNGESGVSKNFYRYSGTSS